MDAYDFFDLIIVAQATEKLLFNFYINLVTYFILSKFPVLRA